jgi:TetR/AcrR family transcriptional regulator
VGKASRERDAEVAREAILQASEVVFAREGFDGARIDAIAEEAGYNKSLLFHYFVDKEGLYRAVIVKLKLRLSNEYLEPLRAFIQSSDVMDASRVRLFLELAVGQYFAFLTQHPRSLSIMAWEAAEGWHAFMYGPIKELEQQKSTVICLVDFLREAQKVGIIHPELDPRCLMLNLASMCIMYLLVAPRLQWLFDQTQTDHTRIRQQIIHLASQGIFLQP